MKIAKKIGVWTGIIVYLVIVFSFAGKRQEKNLCKNIDIHIMDSARNRFIANEDIMNIIDERNFKILGIPVDEVNTLELEKFLVKNVAVQNVKAYRRVDGSLHLEVFQREPVVRVIDRKGMSYYIDKNGYLMPVSRKFSSHVIVASGNIPAIIRRTSNINVLENSDDKPRGFSVLTDIYNITKHIHADDFWSAQFVQIYYNKDNEFELIPRVGSHIIVLGDAKDFTGKLRKLRVVYHEGFNGVGWNQYETINLKYKNQVVCTKR